MKITSRMKSKLFSIFSHKILFCGILLIFSLCNLFCAEYVWTGGGVEGKWDDPANWDGSGYPGGSDNATFSSGAEVTITSNITVNQIYLNAGSKVTCDSNVTISLNSIITQGEFLNKGTLQKRENVSFIIKVEAGGKLINENKIICTDIEGLGNSNITNNGTIEASGAATFQSGANFTNADTSELSIGGAMRNEGAFTNSGGTVTVKGTTTNTGTITNSGDFTSEGAITNNAGGTVTNSGGTITGTITNSGTVTNNGGTISGTVTGNEVVGGGSTEPKSYSSKPSSNTLNWNDPATWENGEIPDISGDTAVKITLNANVESTTDLTFNNSGSEQIDLYLNGYTLDLSNAMFVVEHGQNHSGKFGNIHIHGSGKVIARTLDTSSNDPDETKTVTPHRIYLYDGAEFYVTESLYPNGSYVIIQDVTEDSKFYLTASGANVNYGGNGIEYIDIQVEPYGEPTIYKVIDMGGDPYVDGKTVQLFTTRENVNDYYVPIKFKYHVEIIGTSTWTFSVDGVETEFTATTPDFSNYVELPKENGVTKDILLKCTTPETVGLGEGLILTIKTPDGTMDLAEIRCLNSEILWTGNADTNFSNPANWTIDGEVLDDITKLENQALIIPSGCSQYPVLQSGITVEKLSIRNNARLTVSSGVELTTKKLELTGTGKILASDGTVIFTDSGDVDNPSYSSESPYLSSFGTIQVESGIFYLGSNISVKQFNIQDGAKVTIPENVTVEKINILGSGSLNATTGKVIFAGTGTSENPSYAAENSLGSTFGTLEITSGATFVTKTDLYITKALTNNGTFQAEKVYLEPSEKNITITGNSGDTEEIANNTKITELYCENQADKNLVINNGISVEKIALSGIENASGKRLTVKYDKDNYSSGFIYLENNYDEAKYLFLADETLVTIKNATITVCESDTQHISASNFVEKGWRLGDPKKFIWVGKTDDWNEPTNWDYGTVPTPGKPVEIPTGLTNYPVLDSDINLIDETALTKEDSLLVETGAKINFAGQKVSVTNFENLGEVEFNGGSISSTSINNSGTVILTGKEEISGEISESGTVIYSGTETDAKFSWGNNYKNLEIQDGFTGSFENGVIVSDSLEIGNGFEITEKQDNSKNLLEISGTGTLSNKENISITSTGSQSFNGKINLSKILNITSDDKLTIATQSDFTNAGTIKAVGVEIDATGVFTNEGTITSTSGDVNIKSASFTNDAEKEIFAKNMSIDSGAVTNAGILTATGDFLVNATGDFTSQGKVEVGSELNIKSQNCTVENEVSAGTILLEVSTFESTGNLSSTGDLLITATSITNSGKIKAQNGELETTEANILFGENSENTFTGKLVVKTATDFENNGIIEVTSGNFSANVKNNFANNSQITVTTDKLLVNPVINFTNAGTIKAVGVEINATGVFTNEGTITSTSGGFDVSANSFDNQSNISANTSFITEATDSFKNSGVITSKTDKIEINAKTFVNKNENLETPAKIKTENGLINVTTTDFENAGEISSYSDFTCLEPDTFTNAGTITSTSGKVDVSVNSFENAGEISGQIGKLKANEAMTFAENSKTTFGSDLEIVAGTTFTNAGTITSISGNVDVSANSFENAGEISGQIGKLKANEAMTFAENSKTTFESNLEIVAETTFTNAGTITSTSGEVEIKTTTFDNQNSISANTDFICEVTDAFTNAGTITSTSGNVDISANSFENAGEISGQIGKLKANEAMTFAENSKTTFGSDLEIVAGTTFTNAGTITSTSGNVDISAKAFDNQSNISANTSFISEATDTFINSGTIKTESDSTTVTTNSFENAGEILSYLDFVCLDSEIFTNAGTITSTSGKVDINTKAFDNQSNISANTSFITEATDSFKNSGVITSKTDKIEINAKTFVNKNENLETPAKIKTENGLINVTATDFENAGEISSYLDFVCSDSVTFTNAGTITSMDGDAIINAKIIENDGNITAANGKIDIQVELFETTNVIFGKNIDINSKTSIIAGLVKSGAGDINISSDLVITHPVEFCLGGNLFIGTVENQKNLVISSLDENQNATEVKFSQNDDLESSEPNVIVSGYAIVFNGNVSLSANLTVANDFILLNGDTSGENSIYRDSVTGIDGLFAYNLFGRGDFDFIDFPSELPSAIEENNLITNLLSHEKYNSRFSIADGKTISVNKNFYCNGVDLGLNTLSEWILKIPENDVATSAFAELYNASIKNCKVEAITSGEPWLSTENAKDETGNTNVAFSKAILSSPEVSTISDNIIFVKFIDELTGNEIQIENSCNEISAWLENFRFNVSEKISDTNLGIKFSGVYSNLECTESTDGKGDLSSFYLKYEVSADKSTDYRWNTDATGNSYGSDESTDSSGNYKKVIPNIGFERALTVSYAGLRDEHKNRLVSVGTDDAGSNPLFTDTKDAAAPVLIAVSLGQEQHETSAESQHHYDSHNFIEWQFSEPITFDNFPISEDKNENLLATEAFGKISNDETGFTVAGLGTFSSGKISVGSKTNLDEVNAFYRKFALVSGSNGNPASPELKETRIRLSIAGYVDESNPFNINSKSFNNWIGFIKSTETKVPFGNGENPFGTFTMPNTVLSSIKDIVGNYCSKYDSTEKAVGVNEILKSMTEDEKAKTLYGTWDIDPPVVSNYLKEDFKDIYAQEVVAVDYDESHDADGLEIHFLDNKSYMNFDGYNNWVWRTKLGWKENGVYISPKTIPLDTKGGSRMSSNQNRTSGGIRICTLDGFENALNSKNLSSNEINYFNTNFSQKTTYDAFFGETKENIFDVPYLSIKFADSTKSNFLNDNYELSYNVYDSLGNQQGFVTDLAGNLLEDFVVCSPDKNPPKILLSIGGVNKDKLYILFSKIIDWKTNDSPDEAKLRKIVKSLSVFDNSNGTPSDTKLIDYSAGSRARVVTEVEKISTGIEISLTRSVSYEELKNFYIGVNVFDSTSTDLDGDKSLGDPITGFEGDYSMLYDLFENPISADTKHCFSNFAVNAFDVLYAYDGRVESDAVLGQGVYGGNQWTVTDFSGNENNSSQVISNKDISIAGKIRDSSASKENQDRFSMIGDISPNKSKDTYDFEYYTGIPSRLWFSDIVKFFPENQSRTYETDKTMSDSGKIETEIVGNNNQNYTFTLPNEKNDSNGLNWAAGSEIQFLFKVFDSDGNPIMVDVNVDGDISDEVDHPLFALRLKDQEDLTSIDLWSLKIVDILNQKGGATILNNVINSINAEETAIKVDVPKAGNLTVQVLTLDGNVVKVLQRGRVQEGTYYYKWNGTNISGAPVARGMYFIRVVGPNIEETRKVMVIKE